MIVLILGGNEMLGHKLYEISACQQGINVFCTFRDSPEKYLKYKIFRVKELFYPVNALEFGSGEKVVIDIQPHVVINAIGVVKSLKNIQWNSFQI